MSSSHYFGTVTSALLAFGLMLSLDATASSPADEILDDMTLVGEARMSVLFWDVYDARLYATEAQWTANQPFALSLTYLRSLVGEQIAERSIEEIRGLGYRDEAQLAAWFDALRRIIPDVEDQDELIGLANAEGHSEFYLDGKAIGTIEDREFTEAFFGIWLNERTSAPTLRQQLLGEEQ